MMVALISRTKRHSSVGTKPLPIAGSRFQTMRPSARLRSVVSVGSEDLVGRARIACLQIRKEFFFGDPSGFIFPFDTRGETVCDFARALRSDIFRDNGSHQFRM